MAGGGGGMAAPERVKRGSKAKKRKKKKRLGFHLDMTPLVDVAFLLLTFFMYTTSLITPQVMQMNVPRDVTEDIKVDEKNLFTVLVRGDGKFFYYTGAIQNNEPAKITPEALVTKAVELNVFRRNKLITAFKVDNGAPFGSVVQALDKLNQAEQGIMGQLQGEKRERKFAVVKITDEEITKIKGL
jgi:biopolymer transport protein ExbD